MAFDAELLKKHPFATGGVVIVGALVLFYLLSRQSGGSAVQTNNSGAGAVLAANTQLAQIQAAATVQTNAQQAQLQAAQLASNTAQYQADAQLKDDSLQSLTGLATNLADTQAAVSVNSTNVNAQTQQQQNQLVYAQNIQALQDSVLTSQINSGVLENANNNATALQGYQSQLDYGSTVAKLQAGVATQGLQDSTQVALNGQNNQYNLSKQVLSTVNSAGLNHGTSSLEQSLTATVAAALNQPQIGVAAANGAATTSAVSSVANASIINNLVNTGSKVLSGLFA